MVVGQILRIFTFYGNLKCEAKIYLSLPAMFGERRDFLFLEPLKAPFYDSENASFSKKNVN